MEITEQLAEIARTRLALILNRGKYSSLHRGQGGDRVHI